MPSVWQSWRAVSMSVLPLLILSLVPVLTRGEVVQQATQPNLPVLFSFSQPSHNVAIFRGADLQRAIAPAVVHSTPVAVAAPVPVYHPVAPTRVVAPAPVVHRHAAVAAPVAAYVDPYYNDLAEYSFEYGVADNISGSQFGDQESRFED